MKYYAIKLFFCQTIAQIICLIPQIIMPFFINPDYQDLVKDEPNDDYNKDDKISDLQCKIYAFFIDSAWFNAILISGLMTLGIKQVLNGKGKVFSQQESNKYICLTILISIVIGTPIALLPKLQNYGLTFNSQTYNYLCNISINKLLDKHCYQLFFLIAIIVINLGVFIFVVILAIKIKQLLYQFNSQGLYIADPIIQIYQFPLVIVILWNLNLIVKILDATGLVRPTQILWSIPWAIIQGLISIEGLIYTIMFFYIYPNIIKIPKILENMTYFLSWLFCMRCFFRQYEEPQSIKIYETEDNSSFSDSLT